MIRYILGFLAGALSGIVITNWFSGRAQPVRPMRDRDASDEMGLMDASSASDDDPYLRDLAAILERERL